MFKRLRPRLTFSNVCAALALFVALSTGTAYAAGTIRSKDIVNGQVKLVDIDSNAVDSARVVADSLKAADLAPDSVGSSEIATDAVNATEIADNSIDGGEIVDNSLTATDLAPSSVGASEIADSSITGTDVASNSISTSDLVGIDASGAISLGSGAVANGRCADFSISAPGAVANQGVIISARADLPSGVLLIGTAVPSADTVTMTVCNLTGGTFPALSSFPIRTITFG